MSKLKTRIMVAGLIITTVGLAGQPDESIPWSDYLIPLPKEIHVSGAVRLAPGNLKFDLAPDAAAMVAALVSELRGVYDEKSGAVPAGEEFVVRIARLADAGTVDGVPVDGAVRLKSLPYPAQAYLIRPRGDKALLVAAWDDRGLFYGLQTLKQLLSARSSSDAIIVPLASITDWPDFDERGPWNVDWGYPGIIPWLAGCKLNFTHIPWRITLKRDAPAECPPLPMDLIRESAQKYAFKLNPHAPHYDFWNTQGKVAELYPEIMGHGDSARHPFGITNPELAKFAQARCPCASHPKFQELVTDWVRSAAAQGCRELCLWLTEFAPQQCGCDTCLAGPRQWVRETQVSIAAIQTVQKEYPGLVGRIFFTLRAQGAELEDSAACLALFPVPDMKVEKAYGRNEAFDAHAAAGHWVANYGLSFGHPQFRELIVGYYSNHYSAVYAIGAANQDRDDEALRLLAEWTWNVNGRDEYAFNKAYATCKRVPCPEAYARWKQNAKPLDDLQRRLHRTPRGTSAVVMPQLWGETIAAINGRQPLPRTFPAPDDLVDAIKACDAIMPDAQASGAPYLVEQTLFFQEYFQAVRQLAGLHAAAVDQAGGEPAHAARARVEADMLSHLAAALHHLKREAEGKGLDPEKYSDRFARFVRELADIFAAPRK